MRLKGDINNQLEAGMERLLEPANRITKLIWRVIRIKITLYFPPPEHKNCRCILVKNE